MGGGLQRMLVLGARTHALHRQGRVEHIHDLHVRRAASVTMRIERGIHVRRTGVRRRVQCRQRSVIHECRGG